VESRPLSRLKRWRLEEIVRRAVQVGVEPESLDELTATESPAAGRPS